MYRFVTAILFAAVCAQADTTPVLDLLCDPSRVRGAQLPDTTGNGTVTIDGPIRFGGTAAAPALLINKSENHITLPCALDSVCLPKDSLTVEAWVCVEQTVEWGGILGAMEDRGGAQKGFMLGFRQSNFSFGVSTEGADDGDGRMTHVRDRHSIEWGRWYHVAGTYDGKHQRLFVDGLQVNEADDQSGKILYPNETDCLIGSLQQGDTQFFWRGWLREARIFDRALSPEEVNARYEENKGLYPTALHVAVGPLVERVARDRIRIRWQTEDPSPTSVYFGDDPTALQERNEDGLRTDHELVLDGVAPSRMYFYRLAFNDPEGKMQWTRLHEFDSTYAFSMVDVTVGAYPYVNDEDREFFGSVAQRILDETDIRKGYALVIGNGEGRLAYELAARSALKVVGVDDDPERIARARNALDDAGLYGVRVKVQEGSFDKLPYGQYFANLVVSERMLTEGRPPCPRTEIHRLLRPGGGTAALVYKKNLSDDNLAAMTLDGWMKREEPFRFDLAHEDALNWATYSRPPLANAGEWTHMYANAANTTCSNDPYPGADMHALWFGDPGPRPMADRGTRGPAPLYADGRLYVQGDCRLFGMDAYNGTILWELDVPDLRRANVPRGSSNMALSGDTLYATVRERCWVFDGQTGVIRTTYPLPAPADVKRHDWGYVAAVDHLLYGSAVKKGGLYIGADGEWYDKRGEESEKTVSDIFFAVDRASGEPRWNYVGGAMLNSTITIGGGRVYFIESRNPELARINAGRIGRELDTDRFLVALDAQTGARLWEQPFDGRPAMFVHYLMYQDEKLVSLSSSGRWDMYTFSAVDGQSVWKHQAPLNRDHHGGGLQHPAIVGDMIYAEPCMLKLDTGEVVKDDIKGRSGCGTVSASAHAIIFRDSTHAMWDLKTDKRVRWGDLRPGCWLGMIPAGGMVLAPESGAGCWCAGVPMETSIAFALPEK